MRILKTVEIGEIGEKNAKRIHILKTVELADFAEKNPKRMGILKVREFECSAPLSELKPLQCTVLLLCKSQEKRIYNISFYFRMFCKLFHSRNKALCDLSEVYQLQEQKVSEASEVYRFQKSPKEYVKNLSEVYRKQNDQKNGLL